MSSVLSSNSPLSSHADSPSSVAPPEEEDVIMEDDNVSVVPASVVSTTTERLNDMDLAADPPTAEIFATMSPSPIPADSTEGEGNVFSKDPLPATPPVAKPSTLTEVLIKKVLFRKKIAQIAYLKAVSNPNDNDDEAARLRKNVINMDKHVKTLSDGLKAAAAATAATAKASAASGLKISKRDLPKFQLEDNKAKPPFPAEEAYRSVDHFLSEFEKIVYSSGQDIEGVWRKYIPLTLSSYELDDWMKTAVLKCSGSCEVKLVFSKKFGTVGSSRTASFIGQEK